MKPFSDVHKHWSPPPDCMSCEEIRWWLCELRRRGWKRGVVQRTLGMRKDNWRKADGKEWIYPSEQIRMSHALKRIISGEVVLGPPPPRKHGPFARWDAILAAHPVPLRMPMKMHWDAKSGRVRFTPQMMPPENPLPSFKTLLDNPRKWRA